MQTRKPILFFNIARSKKRKDKKKKKIAHSLILYKPGWFKKMIGIGYSFIFFFRKVLEAQVYYILTFKKKRPVGRERRMIYICF